MMRETVLRHGVRYDFVPQQLRMDSKRLFCVGESVLLPQYREHGEVSESLKSVPLVLRGDSGGLYLHVGKAGNGFHASLSIGEESPSVDKLAFA